MADKLQPKQEAFVLAYIGEAKFNATQAARLAGYSDRNLAEQGHQLLHHPKLSARIREELSNRALSADAVLSELAALAMSPDERFSTTRYDPVTGEKVEVRVDLNPRVKVLELLGKAHGIFTDRIDLSGTLTAKVELIGVDEGDI